MTRGGGDKCIQNTFVLQCREHCLLRTRVGFHSWCVCTERQHREGLSKLAFAALFSLRFSPLHWMFLHPRIVVRQQWRQRKSCWRRATIPASYLAMMKKVHPRLPTALWFMMSLFLTFHACITKCKWSRNALIWERDCDECANMICLDINFIGSNTGALYVVCNTGHTHMRKH